MRRRPSARVAALAVGGLLTAGLAVIVTDAGPAAALVPDRFTDSQYLPVNQPTAIAFTPDGRMLVSSQTGELHLRGEDGGLSLALDLSDRICANSERGLLGVAADPDPSPGYVYVFWTPRGGAGGCPAATTGNPVGAPRNRVSRFTLGSGNVIDPASELVLLSGIYSSAGNHNAGDLEVGKDGNLYVSTGDGGCDYAGNSGCGGANDAARDRNILNGKILRITRTGGIPPDNPFTGSGTARCNTGPAASGVTCQETFATGLRNPFRFAFDPNASGTSFRINDVGQSAWEEINQGAAGADYGWNAREGHCANTGSESDCGGATPAGFTDPVHDYGHSDGCGSITGGAYVPDGVWPAQYTGGYLFGDYVCGKIMMLDPSGNRTDVVTNLGANSAVHLEFGPYVTPQGQASQALYYTSYAGGEVRRLAYTNKANRAPTANLIVGPNNGLPPLEVTLRGNLSFDPDGDALTYHWNFGDGSTAVTTWPSTTHTYAVGTWTASLVVRDSHDEPSARVTAAISAGNRAPIVSITSPQTSSLFSVGDDIVMSASATDPEDGVLPDSALRWRVRLVGPDGGTVIRGLTGNDVHFLAPQPNTLASAADTRMQIELTATDSTGLSTTAFSDIYPRLVPVTLASIPSGQKLTVNDTWVNPPLTVTTPATVISWAGYDLRLEAPVQADAALRTYGFDSWSDGGAQRHVMKTPSTATTRTATFSLRGLQGSYYSNPDLSGKPAFTRLDSRVAASWGTGAPATGLPADNFSVRWSGQVVPRYSETYTFTTTSDDGVRLWVGGRLVVDNWVQQAATAASGTVALKAGVAHPVVLEYFDGQGSSSVKLEWSSTSQAREVVPTSALRPAYAINFQPAAAPVPAGYSADVGQVFGRRAGLEHGWNADLSSRVFDRNDPRSPGQNYDTVVLPVQGAPGGVWELAVPNGTYRVRLVAGDPSAASLGVQQFTAEGVTVLNSPPPSSWPWREGTATVQVKDGRLTVAVGSAAVGPRLCFVEVTLL